MLRVTFWDEASQVLAEDAVPSILRGRKLVVAGDSRQLPPTTFFAASDLAVRVQFPITEQCERSDFN